MIKIKAFLLSLVFVTITLFCLNKFFIQKIDNFYKVEDNSVRYNTSAEKYKSFDILKDNILNNTLVVLGSSDLTLTVNESFHPNKTFNYKDFSLMQIGTGYYQNIIHAATLGSLGDYIPNKKVVMLESMQWFDKEGMRKTAFLNVISKEHVYNTLKNDKISKETKEKFIDRVIELTSNNKDMQYEFETYKEMFLGDNNLSKIDDFYITTKLNVFSLKNKLKFLRNRINVKYPLQGDTTPNYNWEELKEQREKEAEPLTNNNSFKINNTSYNVHVGNRLEKFKNSQSYQDYTNSPEYKDLDIFLSIAHDLGIDLELVAMPVMGDWYDYIGVTKEKREAFYTKIKQIASKNNVKIIDYQDYEYDDYFFYDAMHIGWGGWTQLEKDLYEFYKK